MPLIVAIEPDRRQAMQLKRLTRELGAELLLADTTEGAIEAIGGRVPDLILVPPLLAPQDDAALATALRVIATAAHVQTLTTPLFASPIAPPSNAGGGVLAKLRGKSKPAAAAGCDPAVFADQIAAYLAEIEAVRRESGIDIAEINVAENVGAELASAPAGGTSDVEADFAFVPVVEELVEEEPVAEAETVWAEPTEAENVGAELASAPAGVDVGAELASAPAGGTSELVVEELVDAEPIVEKPAASTESWIELSLTPHRWPRLDAMLAAPPRPADPIPVEEPAPAPVRTAPAAPPPRPQPAPPPQPPAKPEWVDMLDALRRDIDRLRGEKARAAAATPPVLARTAAPAPPPRPVSAPAPAPRIPPPAPAPAKAAAPRAAAPTPSHKPKRKKDPQPIQDEWGFFDPQQCGFTALLEKLDEISNST